MYIPVIIHDRVDPMGHSDEGTVSKVGSQGALHQAVSVHVYGGRWLVQHDDTAPPHKGPRQAHQLPLTHAREEKMVYVKDQVATMAVVCIVGVFL